MEIIYFIQSFSNPFLDRFFQMITMLGEDLFFIIVVGIVFWTVSKRFAYQMAFVYLGSGLLNWLIKEIFKVPRIIGQEGVRSLRVETAGGYSFPSGHTQTSASFWTLLMTRYRKIWFYILAVIIMILIGVSRLYLGVHRPVDVVFGLIIGVAWVFLANVIFEKFEQDNIKTGAVIILAVLLLMLYVRNDTFYKASGTLISLLLGYMIEKRYINYSVEAKTGFHLLNIIIGFAIIFLIKEGLKLLLPACIWSEFLRYSALGLWLTTGSTFLFKRFIPEK
ncbi:MAG: phosphatase PAP2 family protein [Halanaerobiaceae bacterium]|nr:phosphatase PAP2 family protein [Halanaerobiaceae bacterium]